MAELKPCPKCGSTKGYYTNFRGLQFYNANGEQRGWCMDGAETQKMHCLNCNYVTTRERLAKAIEAWNRRVGDTT